MRMMDKKSKLQEREGLRPDLAPPSHEEAYYSLQAIRIA